MTSLPTFIKEKEEAASKKFPHEDYCEHRKDAWRECNCEYSDRQIFLTHSLKESYALGIERAIEVAEEETVLWQNDTALTINDTIASITASLKKELSSIREV